MAGKVTHLDDFRRLLAAEGSDEELQEFLDAYSTTAIIARLVATLDAESKAELIKALILKWIPPAKLDSVLP